jgi:uncharacterized protein
MTVDVLARVRTPALHDALATAAAAQDLAFHQYDDAQTGDDPLAYLVARQPRLIVLESTSDDAEWERIAFAAKTSPAARKMPIIVIAAEYSHEADRAKRAGVDVIYAPGRVERDAVALISAHIKPDLSAEIARQAALPLPTLALHAIEQFNAGEFWEQHETFETVWRAEPGPVRQMYQGILQVGVAYLQIERRNYVGARKLFLRAWQYLNALPDVCQGVDIAQLRVDAQAAREALEQLGPERIDAFPRALMKPVRLAS